LQQPEHWYLFKVLVIGELGVGKTSIIKRYVHQLFSQHYRATIGVDFALKVINWDSKTLVRLQLWDIAGKEDTHARHTHTRASVYYKEAVGAFVVFDVTRGSTLEAVSKWKHDLDSKVKLANGNPIPSNSNNTALMDNFCKETGFLGWFETSAKVIIRHFLCEMPLCLTNARSQQSQMFTLFTTRLRRKASSRVSRPFFAFTFVSFFFEFILVLFREQVNEPKDACKHTLLHFKPKRSFVLPC
uniref:Ras-related protein Rab n=1 Tax=Cyclopterus lumpus TaxID=8103 RepID=A0A8C2ZKU0_CYCLU